MNELLEIYINGNTVAALFAWLAFNVIVLRIEKDTFDSQNKGFPIKEYAAKTWDNWLASLVMIPVLLYVGYKKLNLGVVGEHSIEWSDLYYLGSGFITELVIKAYEKWKNKNA